MTGGGASDCVSKTDEEKKRRNRDRVLVEEAINAFMVLFAGFVLSIAINL